MRYLWLQADPMNLIFLFPYSFFSYLHFFPNQKSRKQWGFFFFFLCCDHPNREWKSQEQPRGEAEDTENDQKWIGNRTGRRIGETLPESPRIQSSWYRACYSTALYPSQPLSRHGSYVPGRVSFLSFSYSRLCLSLVQCTLLLHPSGDSCLYYTYILNLINLSIPGLIRQCILTRKGDFVNQLFLIKL